MEMPKENTNLSSKCRMKRNENLVRKLFNEK